MILSDNINLNFGIHSSRWELGTFPIGGYRESLFEKLGVKNRVGLVLYAIKHGIYVVE